LLNKGYASRELHRISYHITLVESKQILCCITVGNSFRQFAKNMVLSKRHFCWELNRSGWLSRYREKGPILRPNLWK